MDAGAWDERYSGTDLVWSAGPNQFIERELADVPPGRGLDLACGEGRNARWLAGRGWQMTAIDFSGVAVEKAKRIPTEGDGSVDWQVGDARTCPLPADLDLVVVAYLQVPASVRGRILRRAFDGLAVGGRLVLVAHDSTNLVEGTGGPSDPRVLYTAEDVLTDLGGHTFEVILAERVSREVRGPDEHGPAGIARDALVHLRRV